MSDYPFVWIVIVAVSLLLLLAHTFSLPGLRVDNTSIILLPFILVSPYVRYIRKLKIGDLFEAEIKPVEVRRVADRVTLAAESTEAPRKELGSSGRLMSDIEGLVVEDPMAALARLRVELEKAIRAQYRAAELDSGLGRTGLAGMLKEPADSSLLPREVADSVRDTLAIANRALLHGEKMQPSDARSVIKFGTQLIDILDWYTRRYAFEPDEIIPLSEDEFAQTVGSRFRIESVDRVQKISVKRIRYLESEFVYEFLRSLESFGESLVSAQVLDGAWPTNSQ